MSSFSEFVFSNVFLVNGLYITVLHVSIWRHVCNGQFPSTNTQNFIDIPFIAQVPLCGHLKWHIPLWLMLKKRLGPVESKVFGYICNDLLSFSQCQRRLQINQQVCFVAFTRLQGFNELKTFFIQNNASGDNRYRKSHSIIDWFGIYTLLQGHLICFLSI